MCTDGPTSLGPEVRRSLLDRAKLIIREMSALGRIESWLRQRIVTTKAKWVQTTTACKMQHSVASIMASHEAILPVFMLRFVCAAIFAATFTITQYRKSGISESLSVANLEWWLLFFHFCAATAIDEHLLFNAMARRPLALRLLTPGAPVTPYLVVLPNRQTIMGALAYASSVLTISLRLYDSALCPAWIVTGLFCMASLADVGLFYSTRPGDLFKFWLALTLFGEELGALVCATLVGLLYFWSGTAKIRGFFFAWIFPFQFLGPSPVSFHLWKLFLDADLRPRTLTRHFGFVGGIKEALVGLLLLFGAPQVRLLGAGLATGMHLYIFVCGIGPYRWNVLQVYLTWASTVASSHVSGCLMLNLLEQAPLASVYVVLLAVFIPVLGCFSPRLLGKYFGGYRMASFHFVGNEHAHGLFVRRALLQECKGEGGWLVRLLQKRAAETASAKLSDDDQFLQFPLLADGFDIQQIAVERAFCSVSGAKSMLCGGEEYVFFTLNWLNVFGELLNTKWDESLTQVTDRAFELVLEGLRPLSKGDLVVLEVLPMALMASEKHWSMSDVATKVSQEEVLAEMPWDWGAPRAKNQ